MLRTLLPCLAIIARRGTSASAFPAAAIADGHSLLPVVRAASIKVVTLRNSLLAIVLIVASAGPTLANEPPVQGPADAACREQARSQVFMALNPNRLSLWDLGSQIWHTCMASYHASGPNPGRQEQRF